MKPTLTEIFSEIGHFGNDIGCNDRNGTHSYTPVYDKLFENRRQGVSLLEIGLALGDGLVLWDRYFEESTIVGVDITVVFPLEKVKRPGSSNNIHVIECDATKDDIVRQLMGYEFDIIVDDGSHMEKDQVETFKLLKHKMKPGGIYIIEDILALEHSRKRFEELHDKCEIIDLRHTKNRFDDVLICYFF